MRAEGRYPWGGLGQVQGFYRDGEQWVGVDASAQYAEAVRLADDLPAVLPERSQFLAGLRAGTEGKPVGLGVKARFVRDQTLGRSEDSVKALQRRGLAALRMAMAEA